MVDLAVVLAYPSGDDSRMASSIPAFLHPVAGRPIIWHVVNALSTAVIAPSRIQIWMPTNVAPIFPDELFENVEILITDDEENPPPAPDHADSVVMVWASSYLSAQAAETLIASEDSRWVGSSDREVVGRFVRGEDAALTVEDARKNPRGVMLPDGAFVDSDSFAVGTRAQLSRMHEIVRDRLVAALMEGGVTFVIPGSVLVDTEVRIGRDAIIYPGVVLEGSTTIGDETVIGPGCRIIDSWVGSGVELKGWNYISHASVRNRAILEPYVRRGFD